MARQYELVEEIMTCKCIQILNGKKFGTLLGELLKIIKVAEEDNADLKAEWIKALRRNNVLKVALDRRTPEGLKGRAL